MLRRILVPFSELFIMLALMFFALFFISAALGGAGEARPEDELHIVEVTWEYRLDTSVLPPELPDRRLRVFAQRLSRPILTLEAKVATDPGGDWQFGWTDQIGPSRSLEHEVALALSGQCTPFDRTNRHEFIRRFTQTEEPELRPGRALPSLAEVGSGVAFTAVTSSSSSGGQDVPGDYNLFQINTLTIAYRPVDLQRPVLLRIGVRVQRIIPPPDSAPPVQRISFRSETLATGRLVTGIMEAEPGGSSATLRTSEIGRGSDDPQPVALSHAQPDCSDIGAMFLYVLLEPEGASFHATHPRL